MKTFVVVIGGF